MRRATNMQAPSTKQPKAAAKATPHFSPVQLGRGKEAFVKMRA